MHTLELDWMSTILLDAVRTHTTTFHPDTAWDFTMTPIPQNLQYPVEQYISSMQPIAIQHQKALERRDKHLLSHEEGVRLSQTFLSIGLQTQSESVEDMAMM
jgi:hypothetical protein